MFLTRDAADITKTEEVDAKHAARLRGSVLGMVHLLLIQFALGMAVNLFVTISPSPNGFWWPVVTGRG